MTLKEKIFQEYPIPEQLSIWGADAEVVGVNFDNLVQIVLEDLFSDLEVYETVDATGLSTQLPPTTRAVTAVKLMIPFQGNRYVKWSFDVDTKICMVRYIPAKISYKRAVSMEDVEKLKGDTLVYFKKTILERMATKELSYLKTVDLSTDAGSINLDALEEFRNEARSLVKEMKDGIMLMSNG